MKASVAYESPRSQKPKVKPLKWHRGQDYVEGGYNFAKGVKGEYRICAQKPNRRLGFFKWALTCNKQPIMVKGAPMSLDDLSALKAFASSYDAMPPTEVDVAVVVVEPSANESPTREEWEVVVHHAPAAHRGAILNMAGPGDSFEAGNKIILQGFHDDTQASNVAASIVKRYRVPVTTGPIRKSEANEANEGHRCTAVCRHGASEAPRRRSDEERRYPLKWTDTPKGNSFAHGLQGTYATGKFGGQWCLLGTNHEPLGTFPSKQDAEDEAERVEHLERRNTRMRQQYRDEDDGPLA